MSRRDTDDPTMARSMRNAARKRASPHTPDYSWQWAYQEKFKEAGLMALLGTGFDLGVTSVFSAYALKHYFDEIHTIDILGTATVVTMATRSLQTSTRRSTSSRGIRKRLLLGERPLGRDKADGDQGEYNFPQVGEKDMYLLHHEEIESLRRIFRA